MGTSFILLVLSIPFQELIAIHILGYSSKMVDYFPQIPVTQLLSCFLRLICVSLLIACCGNKKGGLWLEIIILVSLIFVIPSVNLVTSFVYPKVILHLQGISAYAAYSEANTFATFCLIPSNLSIPIAYVACGMSIAFKRMSKKMDQAVLEAKIGFDTTDDLALQENCAL